MYRPKRDPQWTSEHEGFYRTYDFDDVVQALEMLMAWWEAGKDIGRVPLKSKPTVFRMMFKEYALIVAADFKTDTIYSSVPVARVFYKDIKEEHVSGFEQITEIFPN